MDRHTPGGLGLSANAWLRILIGAVVVQLLALYWPIQLDETTRFPGADKLVHFTIFALPALAGVLAGLRPLRVLLVLAVHAPVSEVIQGTLINRDPSAFDALADLLGVAVGVTTGLLLTRPRPDRAPGAAL